MKRGPLGAARPPRFGFLSVGPLELFMLYISAYPVAEAGSHVAFIGIGPGQSPIHCERPVSGHELRPSISSVDPSRPGAVRFWTCGGRLSCLCCIHCERSEPRRLEAGGTEKAVRSGKIGWANLPGETIRHNHPGFVCCALCCIFLDELWASSARCLAAS